LSKFVRIAVDWLLMADTGEVLKKDRRCGEVPRLSHSKKNRGAKKRKTKTPRRQRRINPVAFCPIRYIDTSLDWRVVRLRQHELFLVAFRDQYLRGRFRQ